LYQRKQKLDFLRLEMETYPLALHVASVYMELVDEICFELCFEMHKNLKLGYLCLNCDSIYSDVISRTGFDIFGQTVNDIQSNSESFECVNCKRLVVAARYAPHLEKCMGLGRNSSRIANKRLAVTVEKLKDANGETLDESDPEDKDYNPLDPKRKEKQPKVVKGKKGRPPKYKEIDFIIDSENNPEKMVIPHVDPLKEASINKIKELLQSTCGVISSTTKKMCTKTLNCPQHTDDMREHIRLQLLGEYVDINSMRENQKMKKHSRNIPMATDKISLTEKSPIEYVDIDGFEEDQSSNSPADLSETKLDEFEEFLEVL